jgi:hypothetical protein
LASFVNDRHTRSRFGSQEKETPMKHAFTLVVTAALAVAAVSHQGVAAQKPAAQKAGGQKPAAKSSAKAEVPGPIAVEVIAVDPEGKTITVRDIAAVPAPPGKPVEIELPVPATATGKKLGDVATGEKVDVTCTIKPTVHPTVGVPIVLTDCARVIKIEPK